jgi:hypothetical protein
MNAGADMTALNQLKIIVPVQQGAVSQKPLQGDRHGSEEQGKAETTQLNLSGYESRPLDSDIFLDKLMGPITKAMSAVEATFKEFSLEEITIGLAVTAQGDVGIASAGVESAIEVTFTRKQLTKRLSRTRQP